MVKYDSQKLLAILQRNHTSLKELVEHPAMYRWNATTIKEVLTGQREISERFAKDIEKSAGIPLTDFFSDEYISANQPNYSCEKLFDFMSKKGITTKEIERKMQLTENTIWKIITGKEGFTKSIAKGISKLYNLSEDFFLKMKEKVNAVFSVSNAEY